MSEASSSVESVDVDLEMNKPPDPKDDEGNYYNRGERFEDVVKDYSLKDAKKEQRKKEKIK